ncbi:MAG: stage II sporulation protein M [Actinomycetota bacterium]|nr:stage II sporulation protein M [Actinomycetota bacterium]
MNLERFVTERAPAWDELTGLVSEAGNKPERLGGGRAARLGTLYRGVAADLALARRKWPGDPATRRLELLVGSARGLVYGASGARAGLFDFFARRYWRAVLERPVWLIVAAAVLFGTGFLGLQWGLADPPSAAAFVAPQFGEIPDAGPEGENLGLSGAEQAASSTAIFTNNVQVTFLAFAGGILAGLGTIFVLAYNGAVLGTVAGLIVGTGGGRRFFELVSPHGFLELSCIVVAAAAGLRIGWALVSPGRGPRVEAVVAEGRRSIEIVLGTAPWLVLAGLVEGFVTPRGLGLLGSLVLGVGLSAVYWALFWFRGRSASAS